MCKISLSTMFENYLFNSYSFLSNFINYRNYVLICTIVYI